MPLWVIYRSEDGEVRLPPAGSPVRFDDTVMPLEVLYFPDPDDLVAEQRLVLQDRRPMPAGFVLEAKRFQPILVYTVEDLSPGDLLHLARQLEEQGRLEPRP